MTLQEFLIENKTDNITKDTAVSSRISTEKGEPYLFRIKALSMEEFQNARNRAAAGGNDINRFKYSIIISGCINPSFKDAASIEAVGVKTPEEYLKKALLPGEISYLAGEILRLSGFGDGYGA